MCQESSQCILWMYPLGPTDPRICPHMLGHYAAANPLFIFSLYGTVCWAMLVHAEAYSKKQKPYITIRSYGWHIPRTFQWKCIPPKIGNQAVKKLEIFKLTQAIIFFFCDDKMPAMHSGIKYAHKRRRVHIPLRFILSKRLTIPQTHFSPKPNLIVMQQVHSVQRPDCYTIIYKNII